MWNDNFELPEGSYLVSDIQNYVNYIVKNTIKNYLLILLFIFTSTGLIIG